MIEYIRGELTELSPALATIEAAGVGYGLSISLNTFSAIQGKKEVRLYVYEAIREDAYQLYGFYTPAERDMFRLLLGVNGVGAATARMMLSSLSVDELTSAIVAQDDKILKRVKGVGAKTAQRIVLELQDKVSGTASVIATTVVSRSKEEALSALVMLGFPKAAADKVLQQLDASLSVEELIKQALQKL